MAQFLVSIPDDDVAKLAKLASLHGISVEQVVENIACAGVQIAIQMQSRVGFDEVIDDFAQGSPKPPSLPGHMAEDDWGPPGSG